MLHGPAGAGKSGVLYELATELKARGIPLLPLRLDRQPPQGSARRFGEDRGLPDSPALCLQAHSGTRKAVLILDQLDALRWTSAHSSEAFPICQELIRQAMQLDGNLLVVVGCRTFDLENDPQIKKWQQDQLFSRKVAIESLPEQTIREVVERAGITFDSLTQREKQLLANIQNLTMWTEIVASGTTPRFSTVTELSRHFWQSRWEELARRNIPTAEVMDLLGKVISYMETHGRLDAPERLLDPHRRAAAELQSLNVLQHAGGKISFCHQSYLDYQVAQKLLADIDSGAASVLTWLGTKGRQSLFRREQLRLVLTRMRDEDPARFLRTLRDLLFADGIRFHLKQVALQCPGQIDNPSQQERDLALELLHLPEWRDHAADQIPWGNAIWFETVDDCGEWQRALASDDQEWINFTLQVMRSVAGKCGDRIARLLAPYLDAGGEWPRRCLYVMPFDPAEDTDALFDLRIRLARHGGGHETVYLAQLGRVHPSRLIRLLDAQITRRLEAENQDGPGSAYDRLMDDTDRVERKNRLAYRAAGRAEPGLAILLLLPATLRIVQASGASRAFSRYGFRVIPISVKECLVAAVAELLRQDADGFFRIIEVIDDSAPKGILAVVLEGLFHGPGSIADRALQWLIDRPACLRAGERSEISEWEPSRRLIHRFSRRCSDDTYRRLESFLMRYHDEDERTSMVRRHEQVREGWLDYPNRHGQTQYHLLPALQPIRKSDTARGLEGVLRRKFDLHRERRFDRHRSRGGRVTSPIHQQGHQLSDAAWLDIIVNNPTERGPSATRYYPDHCTESSPAHFAVDLASAARHDPSRFARLALCIPADANPAYLGAILNSLADGNPPQHLSEEEKKSWRPPSRDILEPVAARALERRDIQYAEALCRMLRERNDPDWPAPLIQAVIEIALRRPAGRDLPGIELPHLCDMIRACSHSCRCLYTGEENRHGRVHRVL